MRQIGEEKKGENRIRGRNREGGRVDQMTLKN